MKNVLLHCTETQKSEKIIGRAYYNILSQLFFVVVVGGGGAGRERACRTEILR